MGPHRGLYLEGAFVMTAVHHVPRATTCSPLLVPRPQMRERVWSRYLAEWTRWNHVRAISPLAAAAALTIAIRVG